jgi:hypothetical protein
MNEMIFLDDAALRHEPESLRVLIEAHVNNTTTATRILAMLLDGAQHGTIKHCVVMRNDSIRDTGDQNVDSWQVRIVYCQSSPKLREVL